ncbi:hypothetical protein A3J13_01335 [Candidatus Daviesbacteria bacterium RIFCSPLOWO2_02_FULL_36_8]|uniref:alanine--tRNA ligase n=1 Tax=Candidatus Daviesbacteria bacterium RIFCSPLOWO2_02_FULL_36_8 TaxID=1797793 RepID=A0A1F5MGH3_9BACT|nr:MAG: hypothetical protein A3J13_01335 [Candidatus Daviesbacteria bacterium RIFCSPLOWO2_02_FULL_36_8]
MDSKTIRQKYLDFFKAENHKEIPAAKLVPENDPSTLFTSSGMQPLVPYLLGQEHPEGKRLVNSQPSFRAEDIEEVGDSRHTTFFEMLGNWSLGDYFKKEQLKWFLKFLTEELGLEKERLYVSVFEGNSDIPKDEESAEIWKSLGIAEDHIYFYGVSENWWSRSGPPDKMPEGEIGGPDSEVFYDFYPDQEFKEDLKVYSHNGRLLEIGNSVFIQYQKTKDGFKELPQKNVDFGGGLERLTAAANNIPDIFQTDLYKPVIDQIEKISKKSYSDEENKPKIQVIADHLKAATFLILDGVEPSNKLQGYVLRRLLRRSAVKFYQLTKDMKFFLEIVTACDEVIKLYDGLFGIDSSNLQQREYFLKTIKDELERFGRTLTKGLEIINKSSEMSGKLAFDIYQTYGFPVEITREIYQERGEEIDLEEFLEAFHKHRELSRTASAGMFKGGLADHSETVTKYHTATHLLHQVLRDVLGPEVFQKGSNITSERLRFDFSFQRKATEEEIKKVEDLINKRIKEDLKVEHMIIPLEEAKKMNAIGLFNEKYAEKVSIYGIGSKFELDPNALDKRQRGGYYSLEFCGGPHVEHTNVIGKIKIKKEEAISAGIRRIRALIE